MTSNLANLFSLVLNVEIKDITHLGESENFVDNDFLSDPSPPNCRLLQAGHKSEVMPSKREARGIICLE